MKRSLLYLTVLLIGCTADLSEPTASVLGCNDIHATTKNVLKRDIEKFLTIYKAIPKTRTSEVMIDPILYQNDTVMLLINYDVGWDVVSTDKRAPMILMQSTTGNMTLEELYDNPGKEIEIESMASTIAALKANHEAQFTTHSSAPTRAENPTEEPLEQVSMWEVVAPSTITTPAATPAGPPAVWTCIGVEKISTDEAEQPHLMKTKWDQRSPWNYYSPYKNSSKFEHCMTGCVPVAAAQVLYYLRTTKNTPIKIYTEVSARNAYIPDNMTSMYLNSSNTTINTASYNSWTWFDMPLTAGHPSTHGKAPITYVSALMTYLGYLLGSEYTIDDGTNTYTSNIRNAFATFFGINCTYIEGSLNWGIARTNILDKKLPLIVGASGYSTKTNKTLSHAFVIDGYKYKTEVYKYTYINSNTITPEYKYENKWVYENFIQINWGYSGKNDEAWHADTNEWHVDAKSVYYGANKYIYGFTAK